jgi:hypothetical protein
MATAAEEDTSKADALIFHDMQVPFPFGIQAPHSDRSAVGCAGPGMRRDLTVPMVQRPLAGCP